MGGGVRGAWPDSLSPHTHMVLSVLTATVHSQPCFFYTSGATGGTSDAHGCINQCYDNQPMSGTPMPVTVTAGATRTGTNAALVGKP